MTSKAQVTESPSAMREFVAVVGPPGIGKQTLSEGLAAALSARVFVLRLFARDGGVAPLPPAATRDPRGEYADEVVDHLLRDAFLHGGFPAPGRRVVLPNFPTTVQQLRLLQSVARTCGTPLRVLELDAINGRVMARANSRRLCLTCRPDPGGTPHGPAPTATGLPDRCPACSRPLSIRRCDEPVTYLDRLSRYRELRPGIRATARAAGIPWAQLLANGTPEAVLATATRLITMPADAVLATPDRGPADRVPQQRGATDHLDEA
jgi:adenylate kinase family enzyme